MSAGDWNDDEPDWTDGLAEDPLEVLSIEQAAAEADVPLHVMISYMCDSGMLLVDPETEDARCGPAAEGGLFWHVEDCAHGFIASPHPSIQRLPEVAE